MDNVIARGIAAGLLETIDDRWIVYPLLSKRKDFRNPEEPVRARAYVRLILDYGYPRHRLTIEQPVPHRVPNNWADVVVFADDELTNPYIVVEAKEPSVTDQEFRQAVEQGFGYASGLDADFLMVSALLRESCYTRDRKRPGERHANLLADIPSFGKDVPKAKYAKGGINGLELSTVTEYDLTGIFRQAHDALWAGGGRNQAEAFDELDKLIFCKIWDERKVRKPGEFYEFQKYSTDQPNDLSKRIHDIYKKGKVKTPEIFDESIKLTEPELETVVGYLAQISLSKTDLDSKGRAFETFLTGYFRGKFGQYFTPRRIVNFMLEICPINADHRVLDPACGSGGFLLHALDKVRKQADELAADGSFDLTTSDGIKQHHEHWHSFAEKNLFGIEISGQIARTAKMNMIIHDDGHTNVVSLDGLEKPSAIARRSANKGFEARSFDVVLTNPPFGAKIKQVEKRHYYEGYELAKAPVAWIDVHVNEAILRRSDSKKKASKARKKIFREQQQSEVLFLEQCHTFLKEEGLLISVVPDSILSNSSTQYVRDWMECHWKICAVVSLPQFTFAANGAGVKSSILVMRKLPEKRTKELLASRDTYKLDQFKPGKPGALLVEKVAERSRLLGGRGYLGLQKLLTEQEEALDADDALPRKERESRKAIRTRYKAEIEEVKASADYANWLRENLAVIDLEIVRLKANVQAGYLKEVRNGSGSYDIFMAVATSVGFDATGRDTHSNDLEVIAKELSTFLNEATA